MVKETAAFRFGEFLLEPSEYRLTRSDKPIVLRPKSFEVLCHLVKHHERLVTKDDLLDAVWPDTYVSDTTLRQSIWEIRDALKDQSEESRFIKTIPKIGYQFVGDVQEIRAETQGTTTRFRTLAVIALCCSLLVLAVWYSGPLTLQDQISSPEVESIAILPFTSITDDEGSQNRAVVLATQISSILSRIEELRIKPADVLMRYQGKPIDPSEICSEQDVSTVLTGTVEASRENISVTVRLIDGKDNALVWGEVYNAKPSGISLIPEDVVRQIAGALGLDLRETELLGLVASGTSNPEAYEAYSIGAYRFSRWIEGRAKDALNRAIESLKKAVELDPDYQAAYLELAKLYFGRGRTFPYSEEDFARAREYLEQVVEVDDSTALAHRARARILWQYERKWREAEREYRKAGALDHFDSYFLQWMCRLEEFWANVEKLEERSDPLSPHQLVRQANHWLWTRRYDRAIERATTVLELEPESPAARSVLQEAYRELGEHKKAFELSLIGTPEEEVTALTEIFQETGLPGVRRRNFDRRKDKARDSTLAAMYAEFGEYDKAFERLEKHWERPLYGNHDSPACFWWDPLRADPRFKQLLRKLNLPEEAIQRHLALPTN